MYHGVLGGVRLAGVGQNAKIIVALKLLMLLGMLACEYGLNGLF